MNITELLSQAQFTNPAWIFLLPLAWMGADIVSGYINAWIHKEIKSSKMREGLGHKAAEILVLVLGLLLSLGLGLNQVELAISIYIIWMESVSIIENVKKIFNKDLDTEKVEEIAKIIKK